MSLMFITEKSTGKILSLLICCLSFVSFCNGKYLFISSTVILAFPCFTSSCLEWFCFLWSIVFYTLLANIFFIFYFNLWQLIFVGLQFFAIFFHLCFISFGFDNTFPFSSPKLKYPFYWLIILSLLVNLLVPKINLITIFQTQRVDLSNTFIRFI